MRLRVFWVKDNLKLKEEERRITRKGNLIDCSQTTQRPALIGRRRGGRLQSKGRSETPDKANKETPVVAYEESSEEEEDGGKK